MQKPVTLCELGLNEIEDKHCFLHKFSKMSRNVKQSFLNRRRDIHADAMQRKAHVVLVLLLAATASLIRQRCGLDVSENSVVSQEQFRF